MDLYGAIHLCTHISTVNALLYTCNNPPSASFAGGRVLPAVTAHGETGGWDTNEAWRFLVPTLGDVGRRLKLICCMRCGLVAGNRPSVLCHFALQLYCTGRLAINLDAHRRKWDRFPRGMNPRWPVNASWRHYIGERWRSKSTINFFFCIRSF